MLINSLSEKAFEIGTVFILGEHLCAVFQRSPADPALVEGNLVGAAGLQTLPGFERSDKIACIEQAGVGTGVEPGIAAAHALHVQQAVVKIGFQQRGDLKLASC